MSIVVPQEEMNRLVDSILKVYNSQYNRSPGLAVADVTPSWVAARDGYKNALKLVTVEDDDYLVLKVNINYINSAIVDIRPFRLEVPQNSDTGPASKIFVGSARLALGSFPMASRVALPTIEWTALVQNKVVDEEGDNFTITATRTHVDGALTAQVELKLGAGQPSNVNLSFIDGQAQGVVTVVSANLPSSFQAKILAGNGYQLGTKIAASGTITEAP